MLFYPAGVAVNGTPSAHSGKKQMNRPTAKTPDLAVQKTGAGQGSNTLILAIVEFLPHILLQTHTKIR